MNWHSQGMLPYSSVLSKFLELICRVAQSARDALRHYDSLLSGLRLVPRSQRHLEAPMHLRTLVADWPDPQLKR